ncbi:protein NODULATION SIGNALING PATHWAY 2-like [Zingiber officinale]|uniref:Nodulation-signaling pathway 2 protein n=1 Tax=Zingiber officinale TaxID=94328 RepID=A0A8J5EPS7_ZINOF|nr:protein NODULATION SIGNALING PATHWAY 2-like [Zingiber officinale]KAG6471815.1 hypothetical protein ZIOFF_069261 [Zingiber officinale]
MEVAMDEANDFSRCNFSTAAAMDDYFACAWNNWEQSVADVGPFSASADADDFHDLVESIVFADDVDYDPSTGHFSLPQSPSYNSNTSTCTPVAEEEEHNATATAGDDAKGLRLVHLLEAAAEALGGVHKCPDLARVILVRLRELLGRGGEGTSIERLAGHFTDALQGLLDGGRTSLRDGGQHNHNNKMEVLTAFQLLQDMSPYTKFGHFTANQAILEATAGDRRIHVVDFEIAEGVQWASLMQALASRPGTSSPHLRITAMIRSGGSRSAQETGRLLAAYAASLGQPFSFSQCRLEANSERFRAAGVKVVKGEALVMNCVLHPTTTAARRRTTGSVASFLSGSVDLGARVVTLVEEEVGEGEEAEQEQGRGFVGRFMAELGRYSAVWDSLEAEFPMQGQARAVVERVILGPRIAGAIGHAYRAEEEEGGQVESWGEWMTAMGFGKVSISCFNHSQAKLLLGLFKGGYKVEETATNKLVLGWKTRRLLSASVWKPPSPVLLPVIDSFEDSDFLFD